jgi:23S rRNA (adenine-N6)-dimethyltransferase
VVRRAVVRGAAVRGRGANVGSRARGMRSEQDMRRRTLSQNFLHDAQAIRHYLDAVELDPAGLAVEIGAGQGALTESLATMCARLIAYEVDVHVARQLRVRMRGTPNVTIVVDDFRSAQPPREPFHVVGNVPFSLTSQVVDWCLHAPSMVAATIITQLEYAKKRSGAYGRWSLLTVRTWPEYEWALRGRIPRTHFRPIPAVDAGILGLHHRTQSLLPSSAMDSYDAMVVLGFGGVGGTLHASLTRRYPSGRVKAAFRAAGLDPQTVVAFVHPDDWLKLYPVLAG